MNQLHLHQPHAIIMVGIPGSGKTFFAEKFSETFNAPYLNLQMIAKHAASAESAAELAHTYLGEFMKTRQSLVLELATDTRASRMEIAKIVRAAGYLPLLVWPQVDQPTAKQRSLKSGEISADEFDTIVKRFSPPHTRENAVVISGKHTYASQAKIILKRLSAPRAEISQHARPASRGKITIQ